MNKNEEEGWQHTVKSRLVALPPSWPTGQQKCSRHEGRAPMAAEHHEEHVPVLEILNATHIHELHNIVDMLALELFLTGKILEVGHI